MDADLARRLRSAEGAEALETAQDEADPDSLGAATRLRSRFDPDLAAAALDQVSLRRRALDKVGPVGARMLWTRDGLEQATRGAVSAWRAACLGDAGIRRVVDLGCACGADARACLDAGLDVTAVEIDPGIAELARFNLPGARVICGDAERLAPELLAGCGPDTAVMLDPARRTGRGRSWRIEDIRPSWDFVQQMLAGPHPTVVKLGPGVPRELIPEGVRVDWVGHRRDLVEATLWSVAGPGGGAGRETADPRAVLVGDDPSVFQSLPGGEPSLDAGAVTGFLAEPHPAAIRARAMRAAAGADVHIPAPGIAYLLASEPVASPWLTWFRVLEEMPFAEKALRSWVRQNRVGALEIKVRGLDVDPAALRRRLHPRGPHAATVILTPTIEGARALVAERIVT
ncbi:MAG: SAM-dependent methyltransferase [Acidipropionibacterium acidipropionici]|jgi:SAM-dependent methyltransferase|uniref:THUMP-like domain-containing protein n=1 Tax=Acidipropionibacterium acidipropionici TaxID=1748 RepID=UPI002F35FDA1